MEPSVVAGITVAVVRIIAFAISALLAYFGYRLFFAVPNHSESGAKIETPGLNITLSRIAPGTFFAICSAGIIVASFIYPMKIELSEASVLGSISEQASDLKRKEIIKAVDEVNSKNESIYIAERAHLTKSLHMLACIKDNYSYSDDEKTAIDFARVALMSRLWNKKWGDFETFEVWALEGRGKTPVAIVKHLFTEKDVRCVK